MSFSVDDLVSSFSSSHIGQEAMDLAVLHNQLAETLSRSKGKSHTRPCNSPSPSSPGPSSCMLDNTSSSMSNQQQEMDDERMVEELLLPPPAPLPTHSSSSTFTPTSPTSSSLFTSQDPFFLAQQQAAHQQHMLAQQGQSVFAQNARVQPTSPFARPFYHPGMMGNHGHGHGHGHSPFGHGGVANVVQQSFAAAF